MAKGDVHQEAAARIALRPAGRLLIVSSVFHFARRKPLGAAAGLIIVLLTFCALFAPFITRYSPTQQVQGIVLVQGEIVITDPDGKERTLHKLEKGDNPVLLELGYRMEYPGARITTNERNVVLRILSPSESLDPSRLLSEYSKVYVDSGEVAKRHLRLLPPSKAFWFGTDELARDIWSRVIYGSRISLIVGFSATGTAVVIGTLVGILSAYLKGMFDLIVQRIVDALMAFPLLVLALVLASLLGSGLWNVTFLLAVVLSPRMVRVVRGSALTVAENQYVEAARAMGASDWRVMFSHILPNVWAPVLVLAGLNMGVAILTEASLSFLGAGVPPPAPSWGGMLSESGRLYFQHAWWMPVFPGIAISLAILGWNLLGDALRDVLDPRLRGT